MPAPRKYPTNIGLRFGRWTVIADTDRVRMKLCRCECGKTKEVEFSNLTLGKSVSCGCYRADNSGTRTHGDSGTRLHVIWCGIRRRCNDVGCKLFKDYGGRGISFCEAWKKYESFRDWALDNGYRDDLTIDRRDNSGNYEPCNCRWISQKENNRNCRSNHLLTALGETKCVAEWAEDSRCSVSVKALYARISRRWDVTHAITAPISPPSKPPRSADQSCRALSHKQ